MYKRQIKIILFTWSMNMLIVTLVGFFPKFQAFLNMRGLFNIVVILYLFRYFSKMDSISRVTILFVIYLFILSLFSSNLLLSLTMTVKASIGLLVFLVGRQFFNTSFQFHKLLRYYKYLYIILILSIIFSNITGLGDIGYGDEEDISSTFLFGGIGVAITKLLIIPILITPVYLFNIRQKSKRQIIMLLIFAGVVLTIIAFKRSSTLALIAGALVYMLFMKKSKIVAPIVYFILMAFVTLPLYQDIVFKSYHERESQLYYVSKEAGSIEKEGRYWETLNVIDGMKKDNLAHTIFGSEPFNEFDYFKVDRMLHIDYNVILNGSGVLGLFIFVLIHYLILKKAWYFYKRTRNAYLKMISISVISLTVFAIFISLGGSIRSFDFRGPIFLYLGAAIGYLEHEHFRQNSLNYISKRRKLISSRNTGSFTPAKQSANGEVNRTLNAI